MPGSYARLPRRYRLGPGGDRDLTAVQLDTIQEEENVRIQISDAGLGMLRLVAAKDIPKDKCAPFIFEEPIAASTTDIDSMLGCSYCWKLLLDEATSDQSVYCEGCGERYFSEMCRAKTKEDYYEVICDEWKTFLAEAEPFIEECNEQFHEPILAELLEIKVTAMAAQKGVHPTHLPRIRNLINKNDSHQLF